MTPDELRRHGKELVDWIADYHENKLNASGKLYLTHTKLDSRYECPSVKREPRSATCARPGSGSYAPPRREPHSRVDVSRSRAPCITRRT